MIELKEKCKTLLRIKNEAHDSEIVDLISACKLDLKKTGINVKDGDALIEHAIFCYVKANFGIENKDFEKLNESYESLKASLALSGDYHVE